MTILKKIPIWFFGLVSILAVSLPLFHPTFFRLHDFVHAARIIEIVRGIQAGYFPVRWSSNFGYGYGMPLFEFYAPLPYYVGALFYAIGLNMVLAIKWLFLVCSVFTFWGMYRLAAKLFGRAGGVLSAVALTMAPYRALNLYVRGALSEAWGIMALPWVLLGVVMVIRREKNGWLHLLFGLTVLFLSHNITSLIFIPLSVVFAIGFWVMELLRTRPLTQAELRANIWRLSKVAVLYAFGIGLAAFYLLPAYLEKDFTKVNQIFGGYFAYANHFLYIHQFFVPNWGYGGSVPGPQDGISFFLGYGQLLGLGFVMIWLAKAILLKIQTAILKRKKVQLVSNTTPIIYLPLLCLVILCVAGFMTLYKSQKIWDALPFMVTVQFPWRWLSVMIVFLALLVGMGTLYLRRKMLRYLYVVTLSLGIIVMNVQYFRPDTYLQNNNDYYYTDANTIRKQMSAILPDYIPIQMPADFAPVLEGQVLMENPNDAQFTVVQDTVQQKKLQVAAVKNTQLDFATADYPGWTTLIDGKVVPKVFGKIGNVAVKVPAGQHLVELQLRDTAVRQVSDDISLASLGLLLLLVIGDRLRQRNRRYELS